MCTLISKHAAKNVRRFRQRRGKITLWKVVVVYDKEICPPMQPGYYQLNNISSRQDLDLSLDEIDNGQVDLGFHFFRKKQDAELATTILCQHNSRRLKTLEICVDRSQIVCLGKNQYAKFDENPLNDLPVAVVHKFSIPKKVFDKVKRI